MLSEVNSQLDINELAQKALWLFIGAVGTVFWFFLRRKVEQKPIFEKLQKTEKLISIKKAMDDSGYTIEGLHQFEKDLTSRAHAADAVSAAYKKEIELIKAIRPIKTQLQMNQEAGQSLQRSEEQLSNVIAAFKVFFSPEKRKEFDQTNIAWKEFSRLNAKFLASRYEGGSIQPLIYASTLEAAVNSRIAELESELEYMKDTTQPYDEYARHLTR